MLTTSEPDESYTEKYLKYKNMYKELKQNLNEQSGGAKPSKKSSKKTSKKSSKKSKKSNKHKGFGFRAGDIVVDSSGIMGTVVQDWSLTQDAILSNTAYLDKYLVKYNSGGSEWRFGMELSRLHPNLVSVQSLDNTYIIPSEYIIPNVAPHLAPRYDYYNLYNPIVPTATYYGPADDLAPRKSSRRKSSRKSSRKYRGQEGGAPGDSIEWGYGTISPPVGPTAPAPVSMSTQTQSFATTASQTAPAQTQRDTRSDNAFRYLYVPQAPALNQIYPNSLYPNYPSYPRRVNYYDNSLPNYYDPNIFDPFDHLPAPRKSSKRKSSKRKSSKRRSK